MLPPDQLVSLIWTLPPGAPGGLTTAAQDFENLRASRVRRLEIVAPFATPDLLRKLRDEYGIRGVAVRLNAQDYDTAPSRERTRRYLEPLRPMLDTVVLGAEVDSAFPNMRFGSPSWGEWRARQVRDAIHALYSEWDGFIGGAGGLRLVGPAIMYRGHYRDWREGLQPGCFRWWEILRDELNKAWATACHVYGADGTEYDTLERVRVGLWLAQSLANTFVWLGEVNCDRGSDTEQMMFLVRLLSLLYWTDPGDKKWGQWAGSGERLAQVVQFGANGNGLGWGSPNHLIKDKVAYELLGRFMSGERFYFS